MKLTILHFQITVVIVVRDWLEDPNIVLNVGLKLFIRHEGLVIE